MLISRFVIVLFLANRQYITLRKGRLGALSHLLQSEIHSFSPIQSERAKLQSGKAEHPNRETDTRRLFGIRLFLRVAESSITRGRIIARDFSRAKTVVETRISHPSQPCAMVEPFLLDS